MEKLQVLPNITRLSDCVLRILGQNPGTFTLQGTNTYLVGQRPPYVLIDTGDGREAYPPLLESALQSNVDHPCLVSDIIITHRHHDHFGGLADVLALLRKLHDEKGGDAAPFTPPRIHAYPSAPAPAEPSAHATSFLALLASLPAASYAPAPAGTPVHALADAQVLRLADRASALEVLHTPGHTPDSVCLLLRRGGGAPALFSADAVLGQGTAVFADLRAHLASLRRVLAHADGRFGAVYPGHGPVVEDGPALVETYIRHRMAREAQIVRVLGGGGGEARTIWDIVAEMYKDYPEDLWLPAAHGVGLHLKKLEDEGRALCLGGAGVEQRWALVSNL